MIMSEGESLPAFRYHPDPVASRSVVASDAECAVCGRARGFIYAGPVYAEDDLDDAICPWCIADGSAHEEHGATFVDSEAFDDDAPQAAMDEIVERTPGFSTYQSERWPSCCGEPAAFLEPAGITEIRARYRYLEGQLMPYIVHEMGISGGAATRLLESLRRDASPTAFVFACLHCDGYPAWIDRT
jgi:uncharacterized protein CbrC (UPF0167 family)